MTYDIYLYFSPGKKIVTTLYLLRGCYFQEGVEVKLEMKVEDAYKRSVETVLNWIQDTVNPNRTQVFFRTYAPVHFRFVICLIVHMTCGSLQIIYAYIYMR